MADTDSKLRAWWWHRQGLDGSLVGASPTEILERSGWARSVGGVGPYLTLFARGGIDRDAADAAVAALRIHELPAARGCTYVVPSSEFALALTVGQRFGEPEARVATTLGVTGGEIDRLCEAVIQSLGGGPISPKTIRDKVGRAARNLGEAGKKKGLTTTLPVALGRLQGLGEIRRVPTNGRLDQQRYRYALWRSNPLSGRSRPDVEAITELARRYFRWVGPATLTDWQWFSGLGVKAGKVSVEPLGLAPIAAGSDRLLLPDDLRAFKRHRPPTRAQYALVSSLDVIHAHRRDVAGLLAPGDAKRSLATDNTPLGGLSDLPSHAILDRGRLVGLWEYDLESESIAWASFVGKTKALVNVVGRTEDYVRAQLGDARSFSLDSPRSRASRIAALRKLAV